MAKQNGDSLKKRGAPTKAERNAKKRAEKLASSGDKSSSHESLVSEIEKDIDNDLANNTSSERIENPVIESSQPDMNASSTDTNQSTDGGEINNGGDNYVPPSIDDNENLGSPAMDDDIPTEIPDPLDEPVISRSYTASAPNNVNEAPIPEPKINAQQAFASQSNLNSSGASDPKGEKPPKVNVNEKLDDLSPNQKRKAAEVTADALLASYSQGFPVPFKWASSFNIGKMKKLAMEGKLDLYLQVVDDGTRVIDYAEKTNKEVDKLFTVTEEMKEEIKEPLVEVLLENNFALTPTQRLLLAVGGHAIAFTVKAVQLYQQNSHALEQFQKFHNENLEFMRTTAANVTGTPPPNPYTPPPTAEAPPTSDTPPPTENNSPPKKEGGKGKVVKMDDVLDADSEGIEITEE
jgi:hypothetical protein